MPKPATLLLLLLAWIAALAGPAAAQVPEVPDPTLNDIARAVMGPNGPMIVYNPNICGSIGPLECGFMRTHEYGHIALGHLYQGTQSQQAEMEADCWAAMNAQPAEVQAIIMGFQRQGQGGDAAHGTGFQRAQRVYDARMGNCHW